MTFTTEQAIELALQRVRCPWCQELHRPCNFDRHVLSRHFQQLTVYDELRELLDRETAARD
jgi:hypothetical protein